MDRPIKYKVAIIEPSPVIRQGLAVFIQAAGDFDTPCEFENLQTFISGNVSDRVDVILINPAIINFHKQFAVRSALSDYSGKTIVAIVYSYVDANTLSSFDGVIDVYDDSETIAKKIRKAVESRMNQDDSSSDTSELSDREKEILALVARGLTNKEVADQLNISAHTVVSHRKNIARKTGIKTVSGLTLYAVLNNIISKDGL